jgi:hypothetical protein
MRKNFAGAVKNFHNLNLGDILGLGWASWGEIDGVEIGTSVGMANVQT